MPLQGSASAGDGSIEPGLSVGNFRLPGRKRLPAVQKASKENTYGTWLAYGS